MEPLQNGCRNKNVTRHKAPTYRGAADTDYANECSMQSHYEPCREVVSLGYFPDEVLLEVGSGPWCASSEDCKNGKKKSWTKKKKMKEALSLVHVIYIY